MVGSAGTLIWVELGEWEEALGGRLGGKHEPEKSVFYFARHWSPLLSKVFMELLMSRVVVRFLLGEREFGSRGRFCQGTFSLQDCFGLWL